MAVKNDSNRINEFEVKISQFENTIGPELSVLKKQSEALKNAVDEIAKSFSGSWIGWHSTLYYENFEQPPLNHRFNREWGGVTGLPSGWQSKKDEEVDRAVFSNLHDPFDYPVYKRLKEQLAKQAAEFVDEIRFIAPDQPSSKVKSVLDRVEAFDWSELRQRYVRKQTPSGAYWSRDSAAMSEGLKVPHYILIASEAHEGLVLSETLPELIRLARQLVRLLEISSDESGASNDHQGPYLDVLLLEEIKNRTTPSGWNMRKLQSLIRELNDNSERGNYYSVHMIIRAIIDHIPPILGYKAFGQVAANYPWTRTDKQYMQKLLDFKIQGDDALHRPISTKVDTISATDIPPARWLTVLLMECVNKL